MRSILLPGVAIALAACGPRPEASRAPHTMLDAYVRFNDTPRLIDPAGYIGFLKSTRFKAGELDSLPRCAVVLHDARPLTYVARLGIDTARAQRLVLGSSDPSVLHVVRRAAPAASFIITAGLPGAGGISIQTAELAALGTRAIVHVGTAGLLGDAIPDSAAVLSRGSYKDGGAVMLSAAERADSMVSRPDSVLTAAVGASLRAGGATVVEQTGFTSPIIYFQPSGLIRWLLGGAELAGERPGGVLRDRPADEVPHGERRRRFGSVPPGRYDSVSLLRRHCRRRRQTARDHRGARRVRDISRVRAVAT
jgi:hypothetical protein